MLVAGTVLQGGNEDQLTQPKHPPSLGSETQDYAAAVDKFYGHKQKTFKDYPGHFFFG